MKITEEWLKKNNACAEGIEWFLSQRETGGIAVIRALLSAKKYAWANWAITHVLTEKQRIHYAIFAAEQVLDIYEKQYPNDKRPRTAIDSAREVLKNYNEKTWAAAGDAARDAVDAAVDAWAARDAVDAAGDAARAAWAAARAAWAAGAAARDAVDAAAGAAGAAAVDAWAARDAGASMKIKIIEYGISLIAGVVK